MVAMIAGLCWGWCPSSVDPGVPRCTWPGRVLDSTQPQTWKVPVEGWLVLVVWCRGWCPFIVVFGCAPLHLARS
eukprot:11943889-Prorocentrum_lima.AAC.1